MEPQKTGFLHRVWRIARIPVYVIAALYVGLLIYRFPIVIEKKKTEEQVAKIHATKLTLKDVMGTNLPPAPDPRVKDLTVAGIDANSNGIRDDVELAIFKAYPNSAKIRAAELQYALELQNELTNVFNSETLVAVIQEEGRGNLCIKNTVPPRTASDSPSTITNNLALISARASAVEDLVVNTEMRKSKQKEIYQKYMTSYRSIEKEDCDISLASLPN